MLRLTLRHRSGAKEYSEAMAPEEGSQAWQALTGSLLAGLLGIPVGMTLTWTPASGFSPSHRPLKRHPAGL